ncbi:MAG: polysaccharide deacetylase family protein, partial [Rikenellaceae bacterium]|nr:polysaccharide deacetylase family protein [Rikenellaceae bacterium]
MFWWTLITLLAVVTAILVYGAAAVGSGIFIRALCRGKDAGPTVALTFDDGPHPDHTPKVLDVLNRYGIKAAFFVSGKKAEAYPQIVRRIVEQGHLVGNHSYTHATCFPLYGRKRMENDLAQCSKAILLAGGEHPVYFRPPFGVTNPVVARAVRRSGLKVCGWSVRSFDTTGRPRERILGRIIRKLHHGAIILLHADR